MRRKLLTGMADLCEWHQEKLRRDDAYAALDKYGLAKLPDETNAEWVCRMRQFVREGARGINKMRKAA